MSDNKVTIMFLITLAYRGQCCTCIQVQTFRAKVEPQFWVSAGAAQSFDAKVEATVSEAKVNAITK